MHKPDFAEFRAELDKCAIAFNREKPDDALCEVYWHALQDVALSTVRACAVTHIRFGKFFPKPFELRPKDAKPPVKPSAESVAAFRDGEARAAENLEELRQLNPARWLEIVTPKVTELGRAKGMLPGEIDAKIQRYLREGPRV